MPSLVPHPEIPLLDEDPWKFLFFVRANEELEVAACARIHFPMMEMSFSHIRPDNFATHYMAMANAHYLGARLSQVDGARGIIVPPDAVFSANALATIAALAKSGKRAIMTAGPRLQETRASRPLEAIIKRSPHIPPRKLAALAANYLHPEMKRYFWNSEDFSTRPFVCYWDAPGGWLCRNFHLHSLMCDFSRISDISILKRDTIDGEFFGRTIGVWDDIHVIQDSDELLVVTLTPDDVFYSEKGEEPASVASICRTAYEDVIVNPLHRWFFAKAIMIHWGEIGDAWHALAEETGLLTFQALSQPTAASAPVSDFSVANQDRGLSSAKFVLGAPMRPGQMIVQRFSAPASVQSILIRFVNWGRTASDHTICWRIEARMGDSSIQDIGAGTINASLIEDWQSVILPFSISDNIFTESYQLCLYTQSKSQAEFPLGVPLFRDEDPAALIDGVVAPEGARLQVTMIF